MILLSAAKQALPPSKLIIAKSRQRRRPDEGERER